LQLTVGIGWKAGTGLKLGYPGTSHVTLVRRCRPWIWCRPAASPGGFKGVRSVSTASF